MIGTVRNVGYKFVSEPAAPLREAVEDGETAADER
jgi:hypothetical protein